ncbi:MAG: hypothetical protein WCI57_03175 [Candidatus Berkelbacteria bacterium]
MLLILGKKIPDNQALNNENIANEKSHYGYDYQIDFNHQRLDLVSVFDIDGGCYRVDYDIRAERVVNDATSAGEKNKDKAIVINVENTADNKAYKTLKQATILPNSYNYENQEIIFCSQKRYTNLSFSKDSPSDNVNVSIRNVNITKMSPSYVDEKLSPTLSGFNVHYNILESSDPINAVPIYKFNGSNKFVGNVLQASDDFISAVDMKLHFMGNGGFGAYHLVLKKVAKNEAGKYTLADRDIASFDFSSEAANKIYKVNEGLGIYRFPISAKLNRGEYYFLGLSDSDVQNDFFNALEMYGAGKTIDKSIAGMSFDSRGNGRSIATAYLSVYSAKFQNQESGDRLLFGSYIEDLGGGLGRYTYRKNRNYLTALDFFSQDEQQTVYKFDTIYPSSNILIGTTVNVEGLVGNEIPKIEYSTDGSNWLAMTQDEEIGSENNFAATLDNINNKFFYLRIVKGVSIGTNLALPNKQLPIDFDQIMISADLKLGAIK